MVITALIIPADESQAPVLAPIEPSLARAQRLVGGYLEGLPSDTEAGWVAYGNEESKIYGLPANLRAHAVLVELGGHNPADVLQGLVFLVGFGDDGEWIDVPDFLPGKVQEVLGVEVQAGLAP
ncbi:hypothetical protein SEA_SONALI_36 [Arthrobacter phage Sonali]|uniref:DUF3846 domain-containing protein n=1 Tax=Arthrobacter phage Sonali TaxID=2510495 RepID=A0A411CQF2_9CAUD|nr:hypothetical protein HOV09_gp36 [Arthrobacter phage Sonali]QAY16148.1 hypothetical protein SEA_SONALI_36 [Arthrobacter phage Sonali]